MQYFFYWTYEMTSIIQLYFQQFSLYHDIIMVFESQFQQIFPGFDKKNLPARIPDAGSPLFPEFIQKNRNR